MTRRLLSRYAARSTRSSAPASQNSLGPRSRREMQTPASDDLRACRGCADHARLASDCGRVQPRARTTRSRRSRLAIVAQDRVAGDAASPIVFSILLGLPLTVLASQLRWGSHNCYTRVGRPTRRGGGAVRAPAGRAQRARLARRGVRPAEGRLLGNFPQAFSHIALVNSALNLASASARG
jgi:hypothetical protein